MPPRRRRPRRRGDRAGATWPGPSPATSSLRAGFIDGDGGDGRLRRARRDVSSVLRPRRCALWREYERPPQTVFVRADLSTCRWPSPQASSRYDASRPVPSSAGYFSTGSRAPSRGWAPPWDWRCSRPSGGATAPATNAASMTRPVTGPGPARCFETAVGVRSAVLAAASAQDLIVPAWTGERLKLLDAFTADTGIACGWCSSRDPRSASRIRGAQADVWFSAGEPRHAKERPGAGLPRAGGDALPDGSRTLTASGTRSHNPMSVGVRTDILQQRGAHALDLANHRPRHSGLIRCPPQASGAYNLVLTLRAIMSEDAAFGSCSSTRTDLPQSAPRRPAPASAGRCRDQFSPASAADRQASCRSSSGGVGYGRGDVDPAGRTPSERRALADWMTLGRPAGALGSRLFMPMARRQRRRGRAVPRHHQPRQLRPAGGCLREAAPDRPLGRGGPGPVTPGA